MKKIILSLTLIVLSINSFASHLEGGEITWRTDSLQRYIFRVILYRDCNGIPAPGVVSLTTNHPMGQIVCNLLSVTDLSPTGNGCPTCGNPMGMLSAVEEHVFESAPVTITGIVPSDGWHFSYEDCCRNAALANLNMNASGVFTLRAVMYGDGPGNTLTGTDNSPRFLNKPSLALCGGMLTEFAHVAFDPELDSLKYDWAEPVSGSAGNYTPYPFTSGYTYTNPLPGPSLHPDNIAATLDHNDGTIRFECHSYGAYNIVVKVSAWKCGQVTAEIYREIQIGIVNNCIISTNPFVFNSSPDLTVFKDSLNTPTYFDTLQAGDSAVYHVTAFEFELNQQGNPQGMEVNILSPHFGNGYTDPYIGCLLPPCATLSNPVNPNTGALSMNNDIHFNTACSNVSYINGCLQHQRNYAFTAIAKDDFCPSNGIIFKTVTVTVSGPTIYLTGNNDLAVNLPNAAIQWYLNGVPVPGANDTVYTPVQGGIYSVIATTNAGCEMLSNALYRPTSVGLNDIHETGVRNVYVDAGNALQVIYNSDSRQQLRFDIVSLDGKTVRSYNSSVITGLQHLSFELGNLNEGIYLLRSGDNSAGKKFYLKP